MAPGKLHKLHVLLPPLAAHELLMVAVAYLKVHAGLFSALYCYHQFSIDKMNISQYVKYMLFKKAQTTSASKVLRVQATKGSETRMGKSLFWHFIAKSFV